MTLEEKYQHALDLLQNLLNSYGCNTPKWEEARKLIDEERPIVKGDGK